VSDAPLTPYEAGRITKAAKTKAADEISRSTLWPCTVIQVSTSPGTPVQSAIVHMDGDPNDETREVVILGGFEVFPGDSAMVQFTPPQGMTLVAPNHAQTLIHARATSIGTGSAFISNGGETDLQVGCLEVQSGPPNAWSIGGGELTGNVPGQYTCRVMLSPISVTHDGLYNSSQFKLKHSGVVIETSTWPGIFGSLEIVTLTFAAETAPFTATAALYNGTGGDVQTDVIIELLRTGPAVPRTTCGR